MMIKNERQYRITKTQAERFVEALRHLEKRSQEELAASLHPVLLKAEREALESQLSDLQEQIREYEALRIGTEPVVRYGSFDELPRFLIQARIASGLSQRELAERLGLKEQQIQRYEATWYASANIERVSAVIRALGVTVREEVALGGRRK